MRELCFANGWRQMPNHAQFKPISDYRVVINISTKYLACFVVSLLHRLNWTSKTMYMLPEFILYNRMNGWMVFRYLNSYLHSLQRDLLHKPAIYTVMFFTPHNIYSITMRYNGAIKQKQMAVQNHTVINIISTIIAIIF